MQIQEEFLRLQESIEAVQDSLANVLVRLFGEQRPAFTGLQEQEVIERIADRVVARLGTTPMLQAKGEQRYVRDVEAAAFLGVRVGTLRAWRSKSPHTGPPVTRMGKMVMYSMKGLEQYMEQRTVEGR